jgi:hypothetical protein
MTIELKMWLGSVDGRLSGWSFITAPFELRVNGPPAAAGSFEL